MPSLSRPGETTMRSDAPKLAACTRGMLESPGNGCAGMSSAPASHPGKPRLKGCCIRNVLTFPQVQSARAGRPGRREPSAAVSCAACRSSESQEGSDAGRTHAGTFRDEAPDRLLRIFETGAADFERGIVPADRIVNRVKHSHHHILTELAHQLVPGLVRRGVAVPGVDESAQFRERRVGFQGIVAQNPRQQFPPTGKKTRLIVELDRQAIRGRGGAARECGEIVADLRSARRIVVATVAQEGESLAADHAVISRPELPVRWIFYHGHGFRRQPAIPTPRAISPTLGQRSVGNPAVEVSDR